jgi:hypothetical protein
MEAKKQHQIVPTRILPRLVMVGIVFTACLIANRSYGAGEIDYIITTPYDPVQPGETVEYDITVHNLTTFSQPVKLDWVVPKYLQNGAIGEGDPQSHDFGNLPAGQSVTFQWRISVVDTDSVPDGAPITLVVDDLARGAEAQRTIIVRDLPALSVRLSTENASVAPGANFTYTLAAANLSGGSLTGAMLSLPVPAGATFVSADNDGKVSGGVVTWDLGTLEAGANQQVHVTFEVGSGSTALGTLEAMLKDSSGHLAQSSDFRVIIAAPVFQYTVTAVPDPVKPGEPLEFDITVHNLTTSSQSVKLDWSVPQYLQNGAIGEGDAQSHDFGTLPAGQSVTFQWRIGVVGTDSVPEGASINLHLFDLARGASVSRTVVVRDLPKLGLALSTENASVAPGANFTYTLAASNISGGSLPGAVLSLPVPAGATFVSADNDGKASGGVVTWSLGTLGPGGNEQVHVTFKAPAAGTPLGSLNGMLTDTAGDIARASDTRVIIAVPVFQYTVTAVPDPVKPGQPLEFDITVHNLTTSSQSVRLDWSVPQYLQNGAIGEGDAQLHDFGTLTAGQSVTFQWDIDVLDANSVPEGASITLHVFDLARGASVSRTVVVQSAPSPTPTPTVTPTPTPTPPPRHFGNISTRLSVGTGDKVLIGGFIVTGTQSKKVIVRGIGPSLTAFGLTGVLANPFLELHDSTGATIASNDDWINSPDKQAIIDSGLDPTNDKEPVILMTLSPGSPGSPGQYTAILSGVNASTGVALVEVYDLDPAVDSKLANISTRGFVQTIDNVMIGGLIILSDNPTKIILRAIGPSLPLPGLLADPTLELHNGDGDVIFSNDNWRSDQEAGIIATGLQPTKDKESAIVATLASGMYTAIVRGVNDTTGIALVEVYDLQE